MSNDNKKIIQETGRWLRVGFMTVSVLGPVINTLSSQLRERSKQLQKEATKRSNNLTEDIVDRSSKLSRDVSKRTGRLGRDLAKRSSEATQLVADRSNDVLQELVDRSEKASQELAQRSERISKEITKRSAKVSKEVTKRGQKAAKEVRKRSRKAQDELAKRTEQLTGQSNRQDTTFWSVFSVGLIAAAIAAYLLVRKRLQQNEQDDQLERIALNGSLNGTGKSPTSGTTYAVNQPSLAMQAIETSTPEIAATALTHAEPVTEDAPIDIEPDLGDDEAATEKIPAISIAATIEAFPATEDPLTEEPLIEQLFAEQSEASTTEAPTETTDTTAIPDATLLGVVSTKRYYPIETPLTELHTGDDLDVVYFATVDEAQTQGYTSAE